MYKKAQSNTTLVFLIMAVVGLIVMAWAINSIAGVIKSTTDKEACRASVELKAQTILNIPVGGNVQLKCKSQDIKIKDKDQEKMKETIASAMYDCWYQYGEGKIDFLGSNVGQYCFMCSKVEFDDSLKSEILTGFGDYLNEKQVFGTTKTYSEMLYQSKKDPKLLNNIPMKNPIYTFYYIDTSCYRPTSGQGIVSGAIISCAGGFAIGLFAGGIGAIPGCAAGAGMYSVAIIAKEYAMTDEIKFEPTVMLMWGEDSIINKCNGPKNVWENLVAGLKSGKCMF